MDQSLSTAARPRTRRRWRAWLLVVLIVLVGLFDWRHAARPVAAHTPAAQAVGVAKVATGTMPQSISALGTVTPTATVTVVPQLSGYLTDVAFTEGETVTKGQYLAQIDPRPYQVALEQDSAQAAKDAAILAQAKSDLARYQVLQRQDSISAQQVADQGFLVQQDAAALQVDQANIDSAKLNLAYCRITAPVAGKLGLRLVDGGNYVTSGSATGIVVITTMAPMTVIFSVPQTELAPVLARLNAGAVLPATAYSSDDATKLAAGVLTAVSNQVDTSTGTVNLRATFPNTDGALFPNEFVNIHLLVDTATNAVLVPSPAVQTGAPGSYVYLVNPDNTVAVQPVTAGASDGTNTVITRGLAAGDVVVTDGVDRLRDGMSVTIAAPPAAGPAGGAAGGAISFSAG